MNDAQENPDWTEDELAAALDHGQVGRADLRQLIDQLRSDPDEVHSEQLTQRILDTSHHRSPRLNPLLALAATLLLLLCSVLVLERGPKEHQLAIDEGLEWLVAQQEAEGHWDPSRTGGHRAYSRGVTAIALMALLDSGRTNRFAAAIEAARDYLVQAPPASYGPAFSYNECLSTLALLELYKGQPGEALETHIDEALTQLVRRQNANGGWGYEAIDSFAYQGAAPANSSITVWPLLTLEQAVHQGWTHLEAPLLRTRNWMALQIDDAGYLGYRRPGDHPKGTRTLLAIGLLGLPKLPEHTREKILGNLVNTETQTGPDTYHAYLAARAFRQSPGPLARLQQGLLATQAVDGSWSPGQHGDGTGGRMVATALASLSLGVQEP